MYTHIQINAHYFSGEGEMKKNHIIQLAIAATLVFFMVGCWWINPEPTIKIKDIEVAYVNQRVLLDGSESQDPEGESLNFSWTILVKPTDSTLDSSQISNSIESIASFIPDKPGTYII